METKKMVEMAKVIAVGVATSIAVAATNASAAIDWSTVELNTTDVDSVMAKVVIGLAVLWGLRKVIKTMNRS